MNVTASRGASLIQRTMAATDRVAQRLSRGDLSRLPRDVVELSSHRHLVRVGAVLVGTAEEMEGTLLDMVA
jgi:hypothetical protein